MGGRIISDYMRRDSPRSQPYRLYRLRVRFSPSLAASPQASTLVCKSATFKCNKSVLVNLPPPPSPFLPEAPANPLSEGNTNPSSPSPTLSPFNLSTLLQPSKNVTDKSTYPLRPIGESPVSKPHNKSSPSSFVSDRELASPRLNSW
uniref:Uncharacterized protein n=1 Tax=Ustilago esculenta TaxID=185366 RepID=A0A481SHL7_9BASI|nr:hypothetical protein UEMT_2076 [Ustilago esculenta]